MKKVRGGQPVAKRRRGSLVRGKRHRSKEAGTPDGRGELLRSFSVPRRTPMMTRVPSQTRQRHSNVSDKRRLAPVKSYEHYGRVACFKGFDQDTRVWASLCPGIAIGQGSRTCRVVTAFRGCS